MVLTEMQKELNEEGKIHELNTDIVNQIATAIEAGAGKDVGIGRDVTVNFDISCIPEELRDLFHKRLAVMWGEISDDVPINKKRYYYIHGRMAVEDGKVTARVIRNW